MLLALYNYVYILFCLWIIIRKPHILLFYNFVVCVCVCVCVYDFILPLYSYPIRVR